MPADTYTPTSFEDRGDAIYFRDGSGVSIVVPKGTEKCGLYLRRLTTAVKTASIQGLQKGDESSKPVVSNIYETEVEIQAGEVLTLHSVPKTLINAQGSNKKISLVSASLYLDYNATAYVDASLSGLVFAYKDNSSSKISEIPLGEFITSTEDANLDIPSPITISGGDDASTWQNQPVVLYFTQAVTTGDSPIRIKLVYKVDETGL